MLVGIEFPSKEALEAYLKKHPGAKREDHSVVDGKGTSTNKPAEKAPEPKLKPVENNDGIEENRTKTKVRSNTLKKVQNILNAHDIEPDSDELGELAGFKKTLGQRVPEKDKGKWFVRNEAQLKAAFLKNMKPGNYDSPEEFNRAKKRIQDMPVSDFGKVLAAVNDDEE
jgi:hypothetical protein